jgi:hypothetical protein
MTVFFPADNARTVDFNPNDVGYVPPNPLTISKTPGTPTRYSFDGEKQNTGWKPMLLYFLEAAG